MRFSLRNSQVEISFLCLRSLLMLLLRLSNTPDGHSFHPTTRQPLEKVFRRVEYLLPEYTLVIHASTGTRFSQFDFLLSREEIDRVSSSLARATREVLVLRLYAFLSPRSSRDDFPVSKNSLQTRLAATSS